MGIMARKGLIKFIIAREGPAQKISFLLACCETEWGKGVRPIRKGGLKWVENSFQGTRY